MRATKLLLERVNQKLPSAPIVIAKGWLPLRMGKPSLGGDAWEVGEPTQRASTVRPRVDLGPSLWQKAANIARADSGQLIVMRRVSTRLSDPKTCQWYRGCYFARVEYSAAADADWWHLG